MRFDRKTFVRQKDFVLFIGKPDPLFVSSGLARRCSGLIVLNGELKTTNRSRRPCQGSPGVSQTQTRLLQAMVLSSCQFNASS